MQFRLDMNFVPGFSTTFSYRCFTGVKTGCQNTTNTMKWRRLVTSCWGRQRYIVLPNLYFLDYSTIVPMEKTNMQTYHQTLHNSNQWMSSCRWMWPVSKAAGNARYIQVRAGKLKRGTEWWGIWCKLKRRVFKLILRTTCIVTRTCFYYVAVVWLIAAQDWRQTT